MSALRCVRSVRALASLTLFALLAVPFASSQETKPSGPTALVGIHLRSPDFLARELKYRVFYNKMEKKTIPLSDYDFGAALADEMKTVLSEDKKFAWNVPSPEENLFVASYFDVKKKQGNLPPSVRADRLLLVDVKEYGAFIGDLGPDKFFILAELRLVERSTGRQLWKKRMYERIDLEGKIAELQADNQKGLKEGINGVLEKFARRAKEKMAGAGV